MNYHPGAHHQAGHHPHSPVQSPTPSGQQQSTFSVAAPEKFRARIARQEMLTTAITITLSAVALLLMIGLIVFIGDQVVTAVRSAGRSDLGVLIMVLAIVLAFVPLAIVTLTMRFIDRWEPEPKVLLLGALLWGGGFAAFASLLWNTFNSTMLAWFGLPRGLVSYLGGLGAPISEETTKGLGLVIIYLIARRHFNGPTDGIVYGLMIGAGFAFTENILYFSQETALGTIEAGPGGGVELLMFQFVIRGIALPLLHPICVTMTGIGLGIGARRAGTKGAIVGALIGLAPAMLIHGLWNGLTPLVQTRAGVIAIFVFVMVPIFLIWIGMVVFFRKQDQRLLRKYLGEYAQVGWFSASEIEMLSTMKGRIAAKAWMTGYGPKAKKLMSKFIAESTMLTQARHQRVVDPTDTQKQQYERDLLSAVALIRKQMNDIISARQPMAATHGGYAMGGPADGSAHYR